MGTREGESRHSNFTTFSAFTSLPWPPDVTPLLSTGEAVLEAAMIFSGVANILSLVNVRQDLGTATGVNAASLITTAQDRGYYAQTRASSRVKRRHLP